MPGEQELSPYNLPDREDTRTDSDCSDAVVDEELGCDMELMELCHEGEHSEDDVDFDDFSESEFAEAEKDYESNRLNALNVSISDITDLSEWVKSQQLEWSQLVHQYISTKSGEHHHQQVGKTQQINHSHPGRAQSDGEESLSAYDC